MPYSQEYYDAVEWDSCLNSKYIYDPFDITILKFENLPYVTDRDTLDSSAFRLDDNDIPLYQREGLLSYDPSILADFAIHSVTVFKNTGDSSALVYGQKMLDKLMAISLEVSDRIYFPTTYNYAVHGLEYEVQRAPWFSSVPQGKALCAFVRMYEVTKDPKYRDISDRVFNSYIPLKVLNPFPCISCVDKKGFLWFEEFPHDEPTYTIIGMNHAIYGLYDYYRISNNPRVDQMLRAGFTTVKGNVERFRREGEICSFSLKHNRQSESRHLDLIEDLKKFHQITLDKYFKEMAEEFEADHEEGITKEFY